jgi:hypothetical protein
MRPGQWVEACNRSRRMDDIAESMRRALEIDIGSLHLKSSLEGW